ncbi:MAG: TadG family pilus assembly protein, partial [Rubripirellula sp.]
MLNSNSKKCWLEWLVVRPPTQRLHRGAAAILGLFLLVGMATLTAITIDFGYIHVAETQLRRSADAAAMAGCWEVFANQDEEEDLDYALPTLVVNSANGIAAKNVVGDMSPLLTHDDVELGNYHPVNGWTYSSLSETNAVRVTLRRGAGANAELPLLFAALTGRGSQAMQATAVAA